jgi:hypothetical protein
VDKLELYLTELARVLREDGCLIGHIKGYVNFDNGGGIGLSIVKSKVNLKPQGYKDDAVTKAFKLALTNIVFSISEDELFNLVDLGLAITLPKAHYEEEEEE